MCVLGGYMCVYQGSHSARVNQFFRYTLMPADRLYALGKITNARIEVFN